jgi:hypothetical protein
MISHALWGWAWEKTQVVYAIRTVQIHYPGAILKDKVEATVEYVGRLLGEV